jgi:hypothetical protein
MTDRAKKISELTAATSVANSDFFVIVANTAGTAVTRRVTANVVRAVLYSTVPATASANGTAGQIAYDANYIYVCVSANTWKRSALSSW